MSQSPALRFRDYAIRGLPAFILLGPPIIWWALFFILPLSLIFGLSVSDQLGPASTKLVWTLENYRKASDDVHIASLFRTVGLSLVATLISLGVSVPVALAISEAGPKMKPTLLAAVTIPFWINLLIRTFALIAILRSNGLINDILLFFYDVGKGSLHVIGFPSLAFTLFGEHFVPLRMLYNDSALIIGLVYAYLPFMVLPIYTSLARMDRAQIEASFDLGAGRLRTLGLVILPQARDGIITGCTFTFVASFGSFVTPELLGGPKGLMIASVVQRHFGAANDWPLGSALSLLLVYGTLLLLLIRAILVQLPDTRTRQHWYMRRTKRLTSLSEDFALPTKSN